MKKAKIEPIVMASGGLFVIMVIMKVLNVIFNTLFYLISNIGNIGRSWYWTGIPGHSHFSLEQTILCIGFLVAGIGILLAKKVKKFPIHLVGFGLLTIQALCIGFGSFIGIFKTIINMIGYHASFGNILTSVLRSCGYCLLDLLTFLAYAVAVAIIIAATYVKYEEKREKFMKLWFIPAALLIPNAVVAIINILTGTVSFFKHVSFMGFLNAIGFITGPIKGTVMGILLVVAVAASMMFVTGKKFEKKAK